MPKTLFFLTFLFTLFLSSCGSKVTDIPAKIQEAKEYVHAGNLTQARKVCDNLWNQDSKKEIKLTSNELADLAVIYMRLYDAEGESEMIAYASNCLEKAFNNNTAELQKYIMQAPEEEFQYLRQLTDIITQMQEKNLGEKDELTPDSVMETDSL